MLAFYLSLIDSDEEKSKFEQLYTLYRKRMWYTANQVLSDSFDAEDAVHNAFIGIAKNMSSIGDVESKETFAYVITAAKNCALNISRKKKQNDTIPLDDFREIPDEAAFERLCEVENRDTLVKALEALPDMYRNVLYLKYFSGMSEKEIAGLLGIKYATVRQQISRAKAMLAGQLSKEDNTVGAI